jgi:hypothetical protein
MRPDVHYHALLVMFVYIDMVQCTVEPHVFLYKSCVWNVVPLESLRKFGRKCIWNRVCRTRGIQEFIMKFRTTGSLLNKTLAR